MAPECNEETPCADDPWAEFRVPGSEDLITTEPVIEAENLLWKYGEKTNAPGWSPTEGKLYCFPDGPLCGCLVPPPLQVKIAAAAVTLKKYKDIVASFRNTERQKQEAFYKSHDEYVAARHELRAYGVEPDDYWFNWPSGQQFIVQLGSLAGTAVDAATQLKLEGAVEAVTCFLQRQRETLLSEENKFNYESFRSKIPAVATTVVALLPYVRAAVAHLEFDAHLAAPDARFDPGPFLERFSRDAGLPKAELLAALTAEVEGQEKLRQEEDAKQEVAHLEFVSFREKVLPVDTRETVYRRVLSYFEEMFANGQFDTPSRFISLVAVNFDLDCTQLEKEFTKKREEYRPVVYWDDSRLHEVMLDVRKSLRAKERNLFSRAGRLVQLRRPEGGSDGVPGKGKLKLFPFVLDSIPVLLTSAMTFQGTRVTQPDLSA